MASTEVPQSPDPEGNTAPGAHLSNLPNVYQHSGNPNNLVSGAFKGMGVVVTGTIGSATCVFAGPVVGGSLGYKNGGVVGAVIGGSVGLTIGVLAGATIAVSSALSALYSFVIGAVRTPGAIIGTASGKDWDDGAQEWIYCDLKEDVRTTMALSDEEYLEKLHIAGTFKGTKC